MVCLARGDYIIHENNIKTSSIEISGYTGGVTAGLFITLIIPTAPVNEHTDLYFTCRFFFCKFV